MSDDYKFVIPANNENVEVRLECIGIPSSTRMLELFVYERAALNLFLRYGYCLVVEHIQPGIRSIKAIKSAPKNLQLSP
jgi:hypothetical protein